MERTMLRKLERDSLAADLAAVNSLLAGRTEDEDPVGYLQFSERKREIEEQLLALDAQPEENLAEVGLFFGGVPVFGSQGIHAAFAGEVLGAFQDLMSKRYAALESGALGARGPIPCGPIRI